jgi:hypothetical protein
MTSSRDEELTYWVKQIYKGYVIVVRAPRMSSGGFSTRLTISKDSKSPVDESLIHFTTVFPTPMEALEAGLEIGRQQVDSGFQPTHMVV